MPSGNRWIFLALCMAACFISGIVCADPEPVSSPEAVVGALAEEYWTKRLIEKDYPFTYEKELEKDNIPFADYAEKAKAANKFQYKSVQIEKVEIEGDRAAIFLKVECVTPFMPKGYTQMLQDLWLYRAGEWKHKFTAE